MASIHSYILFFIFYTCSFCLARPVHGGALATLLARRTYNDFQISDGSGGTAFEEALAVFKEPFEHIRYQDVSYNVYEHLLIMWEAVDYASQVGFPTALRAAQSQGQVLRNSLSVGKIKNDVLMRMVEVQIYQIKTAKDAGRGQDSEDDEETEPFEAYHNRLMEAVENDRRNSGLSSQAIHLPYTL